MKRETCIRAIHFTDVPAKSPDAQPIDLLTFGLLKIELSKRPPKTVHAL